MTDIHLRGIRKTYPGTSRPATDDVTLDVADGELLVLVGPSGCGKTTLLRMIAGLESPDAGTISIGGRDVTQVPARRRNISMVFQSYAIFPHMRVRQNIGFGLAIAKVPKAEIAKRVARAAELLNLGDYLDRYPSQLSGGQRQRVAVARAIVVDADVLLMDEPLSNLDALLRLQFRSEFKRIVQQIGTTTVYVTHDQAEALSLGDRVAVMREGRIAQLGSPIDVYDRPSDSFVGGFLGAPPMNFLPVRVADGPPDAGATSRLTLGEMSWPAPGHLASFAGRPVLMGVRAENIGITADPGTGGALPADVEVVEPTGSAVLLTVRLAGHEVKVQAPATFRAEPGSRVFLTLPPAHLRAYDPESSLLLEDA
ncbi:ABC transporter ATP-binding protein [Streptomyces sp. WMMB 322]|uniref:ABC transporter ATP-binding protein n=1 Tax=Streptomyces sp. WMMB 322 TaxID=1286821 RepID=UPI0006E2EEB1|nr:ABC transporter ATP-binding protein [Streptomyces sp. WMMB 322]SCK18657.1 carbohydrate ABC transporter ATP-binding protein, CUT1 family (TC 3.A.1.1.-) [Streptomyces sp. WMMB 322]